MSFIPVILCGGSGTRLWPLSRQDIPKQFQAFGSSHSLFQDTALRLVGDEMISEPIVVTNAEYRFLVAEQLRQIGVTPHNIVLESSSRNTAPAIAAAAVLALRSNPDAVLLVLPSDHFIAKPAEFRRLLPLARNEAMCGSLVTFGIVPDYPHTGYGYIQHGGARGGGRIHDVVRFVEKPAESQAQNFLNEGGYFWNSGMFVFRADRFLEELGTLRPGLLAQAYCAVEGGTKDLDFLRLSPEEFDACPNESIDYAVMERTDRAVVIAADIGWSDVGTWKAIAEVSAKDSAGNVCHGDVVLNNVQGCLVRAEKRLVAASGVCDLVIVETADAVLVVHKNEAEGVKQLVAKLNTTGRTATKTHNKVYRPWGHYECIDVGKGFQVKRIVVVPGASLSLQMHHHRAEHWIVVTGSAFVTRGDDQFILNANESTYISVEQKHRLENRGTLPLEVIEVQSGGYLGEDDIVRFDDVYGRS